MIQPWTCPHAAARGRRGLCVSCGLGRWARARRRALFMRAVALLLIRFVIVASIVAGAAFFVGYFLRRGALW